MRVRLVSLATLLTLGCGPSSAQPSAGDGGVSDATADSVEAGWESRLQTYQLSVSPSDVDPTFVVMGHLMAAVEMQLSGEPFAESMGRVLADYSRDHLPTNIYFDPSIPGGQGRVDLAGFSTAVESYEFSKQMLNNVGLESGAGLSSAFGPVTNPTGVSGMPALALLRANVQTFGAASNGTSRFIHTATSWPTGPAGNNPLGWPGLWPIMLPMTSVRPSPSSRPRRRTGSAPSRRTTTPGQSRSIVEQQLRVRLHRSPSRRTARKRRPEPSIRGRGTAGMHGRLPSGS